MTTFDIDIRKLSSFNKLVLHFLQSTGLSEEAFAQELNVALSEHISIDKFILTNWAYFAVEPSNVYFRTIIQYFPAGSTDWRVEFAFLAMAILHPDKFDLDGGKMFGLAERMTKFQLLHANEAKQVLAKVLGGEHV